LQAFVLWFQRLGRELQLLDGRHYVNGSGWR
jgi:hypothetical protein